MIDRQRIRRPSLPELLYVEAFLQRSQEPGKSAGWSIVARSRLAQRRAEKPITKAGQIRALWPEIDASLAGGQSMKSIRKWLEEDAGIAMGITSLTSYISRLRRRERENPRIETPVALQSVRDQTRAELLPATLPGRAPLSTRSNAGSSARTPEDPLAQAMRALSKRSFDIREIHNDGDPTDRKLI